MRAPEDLLRRGDVSGAISAATANTAPENRNAASNYVPALDDDDAIFAFSASRARSSSSSSTG